MNNKDPTEFRKELNEFSQRLEARTREFESRGEFSDVQRESVNRIRDRHRRLESKLDASMHDKAAWNSLKDALAFDFENILEDFARIDDRSQAEIMKSKHDQFDRSPQGK
jgi:hypothetical protein